MTSAISNVFSTAGVVYSLWSMIPGPYPRIVAEKIGNAVGWGVTTVWNRYLATSQISEEDITAISDRATSNREWTLPDPLSRIHPLEYYKTASNIYGAKLETFINRKSSAEKQNEQSLAAIMEAAGKAAFPNAKDPARLRTFKAAVNGLLIPNSSSLTWADYNGFRAQWYTQFGITWLGRFLILKFIWEAIPSDNLLLLGATAAAGVWGYSVFLLPHAQEELREVCSPQKKTKVDPLKKELIESIKNQAMRDFSLTNKLGGPDAMYSDNLTTFVKELKAIGHKKTELQLVPPPPQTQVAPPAAQTGNGDGKTATTPIRGTTQQEQPLVSSMASQSKIKVDAPAYTSLNRAKIGQWTNKIASDLQYHDLTPEEAIDFLKEQLNVVRNYLVKATQSENDLLEQDLRDFRTNINGEIALYQRRIDDAKAAARRSAVTRRLDVSFDAEARTESVLSWLTRCCGRWKKAEAPLVAAQVAPRVEERQEPQSPARGQQSDAPAPSTPDQSNIYGNITVTPSRNVADLLATPSWTPVVRQDQGQQRDNL